MDLAREGAEVRAYCPKCDDSRLVDLRAVMTKHGDLFCFWERHPPCPAKCGDRINFMAARPGAGVWPTHMREGPVSQTGLLHRRWRIDRELKRREEAIERWLLRRRRRRAEIRAAARDLILKDGFDALEQATYDVCLAYTEQQIIRAIEVRREVARRLALLRSPDMEEDLAIPLHAQKRLPRPTALRLEHQPPSEA